METFEFLDGRYRISHQERFEVMGVILKLAENLENEVELGSLIEFIEKKYAGWERAVSLEAESEVFLYRFRTIWSCLAPTLNLVLADVPSEFDLKKLVGSIAVEALEIFSPENKAKQFNRRMEINNGEWPKLSPLLLNLSQAATEACIDIDEDFGPGNLVRGLAEFGSQFDAQRVFEDYCDNGIGSIYQVKPSLLLVTCYLGAALDFARADCLELAEAYLNYAALFLSREYSQQVNIRK